MVVQAPAFENGNPFPAPLQPSGALEQFTYEDNTPVIGREFRDLNVVDDLLNAPNADALIRDLAITSKRFLRGLTCSCSTFSP